MPTRPLAGGYLSGFYSWHLHQAGPSASSSIAPTHLPTHVAPRPLDLFGAGSPRIFGGLGTSAFHSACYNFLKNHNQSARRSGAHYYITIEPDGGRAEGGQR